MTSLRGVSRGSFAVALGIALSVVGTGCSNIMPEGAAISAGAHGALFTAAAGMHPPWGHITAGNFSVLPVPVPVSPLLSEQIERKCWMRERYERVPVLGPIHGEFAPVFCMDPPSDDEVVRRLDEIDPVSGGIPFIYEKQRNHIRIVKELITDKIDDCKFFPLAGPAQLHHCHYKCTIYYDRTKRSHWPIPFTTNDETVEVIYIDHDHLHRCGNAVEGSLHAEAHR